MPLLADVLSVARQRGWRLNLELKPPSDPLLARQWGKDPGRWLSQNGWGTDHLVTSFSRDALAGLPATAPTYPRGHLFEIWDESAVQRTLALGCKPLVLAQIDWQPKHAQRARQAGLWALTYTVNEASDAQRLWAMGLDALITDRVDLFHPDR